MVRQNTGATGPRLRSWGPPGPETAIRCTTSPNEHPGRYLGPLRAPLRFADCHQVIDLINQLAVRRVDLNADRLVIDIEQQNIGL